MRMLVTRAGFSSTAESASTIDFRSLAPARTCRPKARPASGNALICASAVRLKPVSIKTSPLACRTRMLEMVLSQAGVADRGGVRDHAAGPQRAAASESDVPLDDRAHGRGGARARDLRSRCAGRSRRRARRDPPQKSVDGVPVRRSAALEALACPDDEEVRNLVPLTRVRFLEGESSSVARWDTRID